MRLNHLQEGMPRRAEILSIKETKSGRRFYCNFDNFNKRLDEWVPPSRIDFTQDVDWPSVEKAKEKKSNPPAAKKSSIAATKKAPKRPLPGSAREASVLSESADASRKRPDLGQSQRSTPAADASASPRPGQSADRNAQSPALETGDAMDLDELAEEATKAKTEAPEASSREEEIEKLRVGGSMTQNQAEISRIRNISAAWFGEFPLNPWYFAPYPENFAEADVIYICEKCLCYEADATSFTRHRAKCGVVHPPGNEIYRDENVIFFEVDGRVQSQYCRNLCLLSKMFLDHKTLYYDVDPFLFYVMTRFDKKGYHILGYFSKEKESADGYNVACILTIPHYMRQGYGRLLIQFSYELSRREGKAGSPEKPLSDLGLLSYRQYWIENLMDILMRVNADDDRVSIESLALQLAMTTADVEHTLQAFKMLVYHKGDHKIVLPNGLVQTYLEAKKKQKLAPKRVIDPTKLQWKPPTFTASQRTWLW